MLALDTAPVFEVSLANQHLYSTLLGRREGVCKKSTLCTLVKKLKIMDGPLPKAGLGHFDFTPFQQGLLVFGHSFLHLGCFSLVS